MEKTTWIIFAIIGVILGFLLCVSVFMAVAPTAKGLGGLGCNFYCALKHRGIWAELASSFFGGCSC